jgi:hypothetical protein
LPNFSDLPTHTHDTATPMELDYTEVTKNKNIKRTTPKGNCFACGKPGHYARDCRVKAKPKVASIEDTTPPPPATYNMESLYTTTNTSEQLLRFKGKINGHEAWILLDSGASRNFIDTKFVQKHNLATQDITPLMVQMADGTQQEINKELGIKELRLDTYHTTGQLSAQVITLQNYDAILGKPWLYYANPYINWRTNTLIFNYGSRTIEIKANTSKFDPGCHTIKTPQEKVSRKGKEKETPPNTETSPHKGYSETSHIETPLPRKQTARRSKPLPPPVQHDQDPPTNSEDTPGILFANWMETCPPLPQIERILDKRTKKNKPEYLIHWKGEPPYDATWETLKDLGNYQGKVKEYESMRTLIFKEGRV